MYKLQNSTGFRGFGETSWEAGDVADPTEYKNSENVTKANSVSLGNIFKKYGLRFNYAKKAICPFTTHSNGRESTPSFTYYSDTNSFHCYGCNTGSKAVDFVSKMDKISRESAALKIINLYGSSISADIDYEQENHSERLSLLIDFSDYVYNFTQKNLTDECALFYVDNITWIFDSMNDKRDLDNKALENFISKLKDQIDRYLCPQL